MNRIVLLTLCLLGHHLFAQETFPYNGVRPKEVTSVALTHATIFVDYQTIEKDATLLIENGVVVAVGASVVIPDNAVVRDMKGKYIYPSFIDLDSDYGMPKMTPAEFTRTPQEENNRKGAFGWNQAIRSDIKASLMFAVNEESAKEMRALGFGTVLTHLHDGIVRGTSSLVILGSKGEKCMLKDVAAAHYSFNKGSSQQNYPSSLMGSIALLRQTYYDAAWYESTGKQKQQNLSLQYLNEMQGIPQIFEAGDKWNILRADKVGDEFSVQYIIRTSGNEYQRLNEIASTNAALIVPLNFPNAWDVSDPFLARMVRMEELKHWELAPSNCALLSQHNITFAITTAGLQDKTVFLKNLRKAVSRGLKPEEALKALTYTPAKLLNAENKLGSLYAGSFANFIVVSGDIFDDKAVIYENWVEGESFVLENMDQPDLAGRYNLELPLHKYQLDVKGTPGKSEMSITHYSASRKDDGVISQDTTKYNVNVAQSGELLTLTFESNDEFYKGTVRLAGNADVNTKQWSGSGQDASGSWFNWKAELVDSTAAEEKGKVEKKELEVFGDIVYPFVAYGRKEIPKQETVLFINATVWTCDEQGKIENGQVLIHKGKIVAVGKTVEAKNYDNVVTIDATGKHITPGIIDEHSHIALESVNEGTQSSSAEVEEARVIYPEDIDIYRQLSGGVTASQLLHGSANAIGGQSAMVKLRWGVSADEMLIDDAVPFIKFALGENVKQSNWGDQNTYRFPQTRMGVEQVYYDHFIRAREYRIEWEKYRGSIMKKDKKGVKGAPVRAPRIDLELEALSQILHKERFITCHSYVQSEINMLMHVADSMGFTINTFTHILEGYKVADKMKAHGAGGSSFSDWWAYKMEVKDAIPYNGALMWEQGITVAFNSDDGEMARRLNQEAGKAVKYGGVPEEEALKFVTLNPAKLLHLDHRMGSITVGKDADLVIWTDHPLSIYAKVIKTYVDGRCYYDDLRDAQLQADMELERARIMQKMLSAKDKGEPTQKPSFKEKKHFHCDTMDESSNGVYIH